MNKEASKSERGVENEMREEKRFRQKLCTVIMHTLFTRKKKLRGLCWCEQKVHQFSK